MNKSTQIVNTSGILLVNKDSVSIFPDGNIKIKIQKIKLSKIYGCAGVSLSIATVAKCDKFAKVATKFQKWRI